MEAVAIPSFIDESKNRMGARGDGVNNDIEMFELADEAYAVENAAPELKAIATGIIAGNKEDGVAKRLEQNIRPVGKKKFCH